MMRFGDFSETCTVYDRARYVLLPIPFDKTSSWLKGADLGPDAILKASPHLEWYDIETGVEAYLDGIHTAPAVIEETAEATADEAHARVRQLVQDGKFVVSLGGEHSISLGPIRAFAEAFPDLSILHLDAHSDRRDDYEGDRFSHACIIARAKEHVANVVSVGIRSIDVSEKALLDPEKTFYAHEIVHRTDWIERVVAQLSGTVYITIDIDVFDPSVVPATAQPEPGGLDWYAVTALLRAVAAKRKIAGFDLVELCPMGHPPSEFLAAKLVYSLMWLRQCASRLGSVRTEDRAAMSNEQPGSPNESLSARRRRLMLHRPRRPQHHDEDQNEEEEIESVRRRIRKDPEWINSEKEQYDDDGYE